VFDFDDDSNVDGLCSVYGKKEKIILQDNEIFQETKKNYSISYTG
jgi:hypothetical protein